MRALNTRDLMVEFAAYRQDHFTSSELTPVGARLLEGCLDEL